MTERQTPSRGTRLPRPNGETISGPQLHRLASIARAWCQVMRLDAASAALRDIATTSPADPSLLEDATGLDEHAPVGRVLDALAERAEDPALAAQLSRAAALAWEDGLP